MGKQPYIPFYVGDYLKDTRVLPLAVRGAWVDLILFMWDAPVRGELIGTIDDFARLMSCDKSEAEFALNLLKQKSTADFFLLADGQLKIVSRKMKRDADISKKRSSAGKNGVKAKQQRGFAEANDQAKSKQNPEYEYEVENEIELLKEYDQWTEQITDGNDHLFQNMFRNEGIPAGDHIQFWIMDHRDLLNRYPKMRPPTQDAFRKSCLKHIRENYKKPINGTAKKSGKETAADLAKGFAERRMRDANGG